MSKTPKPKSPKQLAAERAAARKEYALKVSTAMKGRKAKKEKQVNPAA